jgi:hypothetical protein
MSKSYRSDFEKKSPSKVLTAQEEYERGLRRRPRGNHSWDLEDDEEDLVDTNSIIIEDEEE